MKNLFFRLTKADETKREVSGVMVSESPDKTNEVFDYETSKPYFKAWSDDFAKRTDGKSLGNVREMHNSVAVGKLTAIGFDDASKSMTVTAKVVEDSTWKKVEMGVLTGFSIGGSYAKKWSDGDMTRYTAKPSEVSLVDNPCVPDASFQLVRTDGAMVLVKAVGAPQQVWDCRRDGHKHVSKAEAVECMGKYADGELIDTSENTDPDEKEEAGAGDTAIPDSDESMPDAEDGDEDETPGTAATVTEKVAARTDTSPKEGEDKYGDVKFADAKNKKYPIDTPEHIRAAWNYINKPANSGKYSSDDAASIKAKIVAAWKDKIGKDGPPSAAADKSVADQFSELREMVGSIAESVTKLLSQEKDMSKPEEKPVEKTDEKPAEEIKKVVAPEELMKSYGERLDLVESNVSKVVELFGTIKERILALPAPAKGVLRPVAKSNDTGDGAGEANAGPKKDATSLDLMKTALSKPSAIW